MIIADMHSHTDFSGDCKSPMEQMLNQAIENKLKYYAITEHHDIDFPECGVNFELDFSSYMKAIKEYKDTMKNDLDILIGVEFGMQAHISKELEQISTTYPFDFIIGSNHLALGKDPYQKDYYEGITRDQGYQNYFESILENIQNINAFDTLGHMDYVIRYWRKDDVRAYKLADHQEVVDAILETLIKKDKALEINTGGYIQKLGEPNPSYQVIKRYKELGGELLTIGSDAHLPQNIKSYFDETEEQLKAIGFKSYTIFKKRKPIQIGF